MGDPDDPTRRMTTPFVKAVKPSQSRPSTARFYNSHRQRYLNALIDFVMLSPGLANATSPDWRIWHPFDDRECFEDEDMQQNLLDASDHFPVSVDLTIG